MNASISAGMGAALASTARFNTIMAQGSYAFQDFATVIAMKGFGFGEAMRAASNNLGMMAMMIGGTTGSIAAAVVTLGAVAVPMWQRFASGAETAKEAVDAMKASFEKVKNAGQRMDEERGSERELRDLNDPDTGSVESRSKTARAALKKAQDEDADDAANEAEIARRTARGRALIEKEKVVREKWDKSGWMPRFIPEGLGGVKPIERKMPEKEFEELGRQDKENSDALAKIRAKRIANERKIAGLAPIEGHLKQEEMNRITGEQEDEMDQMRRETNNKLYGERARRNTENEMELLGRNKANQRTAAPRESSAADIMAQLKDDLALIARSAYEATDKTAMGEQAKSAAETQLIGLRNQGNRDSYGFSGITDFAKQLQASLSPNAALQAQKDTASGVRITNGKMDSLIKEVKNINTGFQ